MEQLGFEKRECVIIAGILQGKTYAEIGEKIFISESGVKHAASRVFGKFNCSNRKQFEDFARSLNLVFAEDVLRAWRAASYSDSTPMP